MMDWIVLVIASFTQYPLRRLFRGLNQMETMTCRKNSKLYKNHVKYVKNVEVLEMLKKIVEICTIVQISDPNLY